MTGQEAVSELRQWATTHASTLRLAASYLLIIMVMSIGFSFLFYQTSERELTRQLPPDSVLVSPAFDFSPYRVFFSERIQEGRDNLRNSLILLNMLTLLVGAGLSYLLARRTLAPIEAAMEAQARFAADASHELRTPLAAIQTENEVALRSPKLTLPRAKALLASNLEETVRLRTLAERLLRLARSNTEPLALNAVDTTVAVREAVQVMAPFATLKHITIDNTVAVHTVHANQAALEEVLQILLDNAIKYSPGQTTIRISAEASEQEVRLHVVDQGIGIGTDDLLHIFDRFYRADHARSKLQVDGHGLGLSLAQTLGAEMGGTITVDSIVGKGSTFTIQLPRATP